MKRAKALQRLLVYMIVSTAGIILPCFFFCASVCAGTIERHGGQLVLSTTSDPRSFNPVLAKETSTTAVLAPVFEGLTTVNAEDLRVIPNLAQRWEFSPDGLIATFYLRPGLKWSDGHPLTADDVVFTFNDLLFNETIPNSARDIFMIDGQLPRVERAGELAVRFILPSPFAPFLRSMGQEILPRHLLFEAVAAGQFNSTWGIDTDPRQIVGSGPFVIVRYVPGQKVEYAPNPYYWKKGSSGETLPYLQRMVYMIVPSPDVELLKFLEGSVDVYDIRGMDYPYLVPRQAEKDFTVYELGPDMGSSFVVFNQNPGINPQTKQEFVAPHKLKWFLDVRFRQAVAHALDRGRMIEIVKNGLGFPQYSPESPAAGFFHCPDVRRYEYDPARARALLEAMGFADRDRDGILEDADGHPLEFTLLTNADNGERVDIAGIARRDLETLGMKVNLRLVEFNTLVGKLTSTLDWEAVVLGLTGGVDPHFGQNVWLSSGQLHMWNPRQAQPASEWERRVDELFALGAGELNEDRRKTYYDEYQKLVADNVPLIYTVLGARVTAVRNRFGNLRPSTYGGVLHNLEEIYVRD